MSAGCLSEGELIARAQEGCGGSFGALVARYEADLLAFLRKRLPADEDARDAAQEALLKAWSALRRFDRGRPFKPWLYTIASREAVTLLRRRKARRDGRARLAREPGGASGENGAVASAGGEGENPWVLAESVLSREALTAMWLRYGEDMEVGQVARVLGKSAVATRVMLMRARRRLADAWDAGEGSGS